MERKDWATLAFFALLLFVVIFATATGRAPW